MLCAPVASLGQLILLIQGLQWEMVPVVQLVPRGTMILPWVGLGHQVAEGHN